MPRAIVSVLRDKSETVTGRNPLSPHRLAFIEEFLTAGGAPTRALGAGFLGGKRLAMLFARAIGQRGRGGGVASHASSVSPVMVTAFIQVVKKPSNILYDRPRSTQ